MKYIIYLFIFIIHPPDLFAQVAGELDESFGLEGITITDFGPNPGGLYSSDYPYKVGLQSDGKIIVSGTFLTDEGHVFAISRYSSSGELDLDFGSEGKIKMPVGESIGFPITMLIQTDDKIIVAGSSEEDDFSEPDFVMVRFNSNGKIDSSFDFDGIVLTDINDSYDNISALAMFPDNSILAAGHKQDETSEYGDIAICKYDPFGNLDTTFGISGKVVFDLGYNDRATSIIINSDGKIIIGGYAHYIIAEAGDYYYFSDMALIRFFGDGQIDSSFGINGVAITPVFGYEAFLTKLLPVPDGKYISAVMLGAVTMQI